MSSTMFPKIFFALGFDFNLCPSNKGYGGMIFFCLICSTPRPFTEPCINPLAFPSHHVLLPLTPLLHIAVVEMRYARDRETGGEEGQRRDERDLA